MHIWCIFWCLNTFSVKWKKIQIQKNLIVNTQNLYFLLHLITTSIKYWNLEYEIILSILEINFTVTVIFHIEICLQYFELKNYLMWSSIIRTINIQTSLVWQYLCMLVWPVILVVYWTRVGVHSIVFHCLFVPYCIQTSVYLDSTMCTICHSMFVCAVCPSWR